MDNVGGGRGGGQQQQQKKYLWIQVTPGQVDHLIGGIIFLGHFSIKFHLTT